MFARILVFLIATAAFGATHPRTTRPSSLSLRKRIHVNPLITDPGTFELDGSGAFSVDGSWSLPSAVRFSPAWGRTEFSASFDARQFDRATFAATLVALDTDHFDLAVAPLASATLRGDRGVRGGGAVIARYDGDANSGGVTASWIAGTVDVGAGYGRVFRKLVTAHVNGQWEKSTGTARVITLIEGVEYQIKDPLAVDVSAQHQNLWGGHIDHQIIVGVTFRTPRLHR